MKQLLVCLCLPVGSVVAVRADVVTGRNDGSEDHVLDIQVKPSIWRCFCPYSKNLYSTSRTVFFAIRRHSGHHTNGSWNSLHN